MKSVHSLPGHLPTVDSVGLCACVHVCVIRMFSVFCARQHKISREVGPILPKVQRQENARSILKMEISQLFLENKWYVEEKQKVTHIEGEDGSIFYSPCKMLDKLLYLIL